jgi:hypothetical protein
VKVDVVVDHVAVRLDLVIPGASGEGVVVRLAEEIVIALPSGQDVVTIPGADQVMAVPAVDRVRARAAHDRVVPCSAVDLVRRRRRLGTAGVARVVGLDGVVPVTPGNRVATLLPLQEVPAVSADDDVVSLAGAGADRERGERDELVVGVEEVHEHDVARRREARRGVAVDAEAPRRLRGDDRAGVREDMEVGHEVDRELVRLPGLRPIGDYAGSVVAKDDRALCC